VQRKTNKHVEQKFHHSYTLDIWNSSSGRVVVFLDHLATGKKTHFFIKKMEQERKHNLRDFKKNTAHCCQYCDMALYPE